VPVCDDVLPATELLRREQRLRHVGLRSDLLCQSAAVRPVVARRFYVGLSTACLAIAVIGFMLTYWLQLAPSTFDGPPLVHLHAVLFSAWPVYFLMQTLLAARGQVARHRAWGLLGVSLATAMVLVGIALANDVLVTRLEEGARERPPAHTM
jgi:hypothetical protein